MVSFVNSALWVPGAHSVQAEVLRQRREQEKPELEFLMGLCAVQRMLGRHFILLTAGSSSVFQDSILNKLAKAGGQVCRCDQCMYELPQDRGSTPGNLIILSSITLTDVSRKCDKSHDHSVAGRRGKTVKTEVRRSVPPHDLVKAILKNVSAMVPAAYDGGRMLSGDKLPTVFQLQALMSSGGDPRYQTIAEECLAPWCSVEASQEAVTEEVPIRLKKQ